MINRYFLRTFYGLVLLIALAGQSLAARDWLGWPLLAAVAAVAGVEFGGVILSMHADERRRLGERALPARFLAAAVASGAVALNWLGHGDHLVGGFFAGMSGLGFGIWLIDSAAKRRDALRAAGKLPPTAPVFGVVQWLRHPWLTRRARSLALRDPSLGLYGSLSAATAAVRSERRQTAIAAELRRMIASAAGPTMATVAVNTFDMDEIARRLAANADYDGLAARLAAQLTPAALAPGELSSGGQLTAAPADQLPAEEQVSDAGQVNDSAQVSQVGHLELTGSGQTPRGEDSPRQLSRVGQSAGTDISAPEPDDLLDLAASLADQPHYPLPREQARTANGNGDGLSLAGLFSGGTPQSATPAAALNGRSNGAHVTANLALTERPEPTTVDAHDTAQGDARQGDQVSTRWRSRRRSRRAHFADHETAAGALTPPLVPEPDGAHFGAQSGDHDGAQNDATSTAKTSVKVSGPASAKKPTSNERKVAQALKRHPDETAAEIARRTGIPAPTVRRIRAKLRTEQAEQVAS